MSFSNAGPHLAHNSGLGTPGDSNSSWAIDGMKYGTVVRGTKSDISECVALAHSLPASTLRSQSLSTRSLDTRSRTNFASGAFDRCSCLVYLMQRSHERYRVLNEFQGPAIMHAA